MLRASLRRLQKESTRARGLRGRCTTAETSKSHKLFPLLAHRLFSRSTHCHGQLRGLQSRSARLTLSCALHAATTTHDGISEGDYLAQR